MTEMTDNTVMTVGDGLAWAGASLEEAELEEPVVEAEYLLAALLDYTKGELYLNRTRRMSSAESSAFRSAVERRSSGEPPQYIIGEQEFRGLAFKVNSDVLIPRPETELLVEEVVAVLRGRKWVGESEESPLVIDLCTGSGCIAVTVAHEIEWVRCIATDLSASALEVAKDNAISHGVDEMVTFKEGDLFAPIDQSDMKGQVEIIVSNPPYVPRGDIAALQPEVSSFEPRTALDGGEDGLGLIRRIVAGAPRYLAVNGTLILEIGYGQAENVRAIFEESDSSWTVEVKRDYAGIERIVKARSCSDGTKGPEEMVK
ncbi:MAG: peptide chain release factor N(5)-glutamine methyltransferase [Deltaproteobacteria bacterium]|nr:peptide chain release factor N(5)-glutamine methyltransferase [Deltaproteobacteria bacterium]